jgi:uncharacterized protein DUF6544
MRHGPTLDEIWKSTPPAKDTFQPEHLAHLPPAARRYLERAIKPGTPLASAVRFRMHGEIKLDEWLPFTADQVTRWGHGMIWRATVRKNGIPIRGSDRFWNGEAVMRWKVFGIIRVMTASGPDISRSGAGRVMAEAVWLPSVLCGSGVSWTAKDEFHPRARLAVRPEVGELALLPSTSRAGSRPSVCRAGATLAAQSSTMWVSAP